MTVKSSILLLIPLGMFGCTDASTDGTEELCPVWYVDVDEDGFGDPDNPIELCSDEQSREGLVANRDDCDDLDPDINPDGEEVCDLAGFDEDCDGWANDLDPDYRGGVETWADEDGDGYGDPGSALQLLCDVPQGRADNFGDCNDAEEFTYPGAAYNESDTLCMTDADGDGYGNTVSVPGATAGTDCDDTNPAAYPLAQERFDDLVDQDCDGDARDWFMEDDFELGEPRPEVIPRLLNTEITTEFAHSGKYSVKMPAFTNLVFREIDTSYTGIEGQDVPPEDSYDWGCRNFKWSFWAKRGPNAPDSGDTITLQGYDGNQYDDIFVLEGNGVTDDEFKFYTGTIQTERVYHDSLRLRIRASGFDDEEFFYIDDVRIACTGPDVDGDQVGRNEDCNDSDARHWSDCGLCTDDDNDGYGPLPDKDPKTVDSFCDLGNTDCDDTDGLRSPAALDETPDGLDQNCDEIDGPGFFDSFEDGAIDTDIWDTVTGQWDYQSVYVNRGFLALQISGGSEADTDSYNMLPCDEIGYAIQVKRGPSVPESGDQVRIQWFDGQGWQDGFNLSGGVTDGDLIRYRGYIDDPLAFWVGFKVRLAGTGDVNDDWFVDDVGMACNPTDTDGDGYWDGIEDCDSGLPPQGNAQSSLHWSDCGKCIDLDLDGFGEECDLGPDCDDDDPNVNPLAFDEVGDGVDTDCNGFDGPGIMDDFDTGSIDNGVWTGMSGSYFYDAFTRYAGDYSLRFYGQFLTPTFAESVRMNTTPCESMKFEYRARNYWDGLTFGDFFQMQYFDGTDWRIAEQWDGSSANSTAWLLRQGVFAGPGVVSDDNFRVRMFMAASYEYVRFDDLAVTCGSDNADGDIRTVDDDCDDKDPLHWDDCGLCTDADGDGFGVGCDLGPDCNDAVPTINPQATEIAGDGIDQDCDNFDDVRVGGDSFDEGYVQGTPGSWEDMTGPVWVRSTYSTDGDYSLNLWGTGRALTETIDTRSCNIIAYRMDIRNGQTFSTMESTDPFRVYYIDDSGLEVEADVFLGSDLSTSAFERVVGFIDTNDAKHADFQIVLQNGATGSYTDQVFVDNFVFGCTQDGDGDGFPAAIDCDDTDQRHWSDCGLCVDADDDGYGADCDLGPDCDDGDDAVYPGAEDISGDGVDADCSGTDGIGVFSDFETATPVPGFTEFTGQASFVTTNAYSGIYSVFMNGETGTGGGTIYAMSLDLDSKTCPQMAYEFQLLEGPTNSPEATDWIAFQGNDAGTWTDIVRQNGRSRRESSFTRYFGTSTGWLDDDTEFRFTNQGSCLNCDNWLLDDVAIGCDDDEDGLSTPAEAELYGTDPDVNDTDGDKVNDGDEVAAGTDPLDPLDF